MSTIIEIHELPRRLEEALRLAAAGRDVILVDGAVPRAKIVAYQPAPIRVPGLHGGAIQTSADFDAPLADDYWTGQS
jgi:antitoxin (DNA-binding transcriptional repressor) of toxin-antitoxin stability system